MVSVHVKLESGREMVRVYMHDMATCNLLVREVLGGKAELN